MSITSVTDRIQRIEAQITELQSIRPAAAATAGFAETLDRAAAADGTTDASATAAAAGLPGATTAAAPTDAQAAVVAEADKYVGLPYVWGGTSITRGVDCSGLVQSVYRSLGYDLPRLSADQARSGRPVASMAQAQPGDLIAWDNSSRNDGADHIAIYLGAGRMIEAPRPGLRVRVTDVPSTPDYIRRVLPDPSAAAADSSGRDVSSPAAVATWRSSFDLRSAWSTAREARP